MERLNLRHIIKKLKPGHEDAVKRDNQKYDSVFVSRYQIVGGPLGGSITEYRERILKEVNRGEEKEGGD